jgi:hypothetical protein
LFGYDAGGSLEGPRVSKSSGMGPTESARLAEETCESSYARGRIIGLRLAWPLTESPHALGLRTLRLGHAIIQGLELPLPPVAFPESEESGVRFVAVGRAVAGSCVPVSG